MKSSFKIILTITVLAGLITSCSKQPGEGGKSGISGTVYNSVYHKEYLIEKEVAREQNVYITYGDNEVYDDAMDTDNDGMYNFKYLRSGSYKVFGYSDCDTCASGKVAVELAVELSGNDPVVANDLELRKQVQIDDGAASISGFISVDEYNLVNQLIDSYAGQDIRVYAMYENEVVAFDDIRTSGAGAFKFDNLIPGEYTIYVISMCYPAAGCPGNEKVVSTSVILTGKNQDASAGTLVIEKHA